MHVGVGWLAHAIGGAVALAGQEAQAQSSQAQVCSSSAVSAWEGAIVCFGLVSEDGALGHRT